MRHLLGCAVVVIGMVLGGWGQTSGQEAAIRQVLQSQVEAWNHHDLDTFMAGYCHGNARMAADAGALSQEVPVARH